MGRSRKLSALVKRQRGILLDVSRGGTPQTNAVVLSQYHDPRRLPWPLPDGCVHTAVVTHVLEFLPPDQFFKWWDELHRVMRPNGVVYVSGPYGGDESMGWVTEPEHLTRVVEPTFAWLDPRTPFYALHADRGREPPKPWHPLSVSRVPGLHGTISYNVVLQQVP